MNASLARSNPTSPQALACPLWKRLAALLYDAVAVLAIVMVVGYLCQRLTHGQLIETGPNVRIAWWYQPLQGAIVAAYFLCSWLRGGQTLGMRSWRLRLTMLDGTPLHFVRALLRLVIAVSPILQLWTTPWLGVRNALWTMLLTWLLWLTPALFDPRRRILPDLLTGTAMQRLR